MVTGSNGQLSRRHGKEDQDLSQIEEVVERRHLGEKEGGQKGKEEKTELRRCRQGEGRTPEVNLTVQEKNVERVLAKPEGGRGMPSSAPRELLGRHERGCITRQGRQASKHVTGKGVDAEAQVLSSQ